MAWLQSSVFKIGSFTLFLGSPIAFGLVCLSTLAVAGSTKSFLKRKLLVCVGIAPSTGETLSTIAAYSVGSICFFLLLQLTGFNLASLTVIAGSLGIGIGFGLQDAAKNFISGLTILIEQRLKVGDYVDWEGFAGGYIDDISLRSTVIKTITGRHIVLPNSFLVEHRITNWTYQSNKGWLDIPVSVAHGSDPVAVVEILLDSAALEERVSVEHPAVVYFTSVSENALHFTLWVWVEEIDKGYIVVSSLNFIIEYKFRQHGIQFAFPRLSVWQPSIPSELPSTLPKERHANPLLFKAESTSQRLTSTRTFLSRLVYLQNCSEIELRKLIEIGYRKSLEPGEILYRKGERGHTLYIVLCGCVEYAIEQLEEEPTRLKAGQFVGDLSLLLGVERLVTVKAVEETVLFTIHKQGFESLSRSQPRLYEILIQELAKAQAQLSQQQQRLRELNATETQMYNRHPALWVRNQLEKLFSRTLEKKDG